MTTDNIFTATADYAAAQTNEPIKAAPATTGHRIYITDVVVSNGATAGQVKFVEDTGGTPIDRIESLHLGINGGAVLNFTNPVQLTAGVDFGVTSTTADDFSVTITGYEGF